jgi:hypothetical protein
MQSQNRKRLLIFAGFYSLLLVIALIFIINHRSNKNPGDSGQYKDPLSHQTVSNPTGKKPDTVGVPPVSPLYLGIDKLLDYGLTFTQLTELKQAFYKYSRSLSQPLEEISIDVGNITAQHDPTVHNSPFLLLFKVKLDRKTDLQAKVLYNGVSDLRLYLTRLSDGTTVYDSGVVLQEGIGD